MPITQTLRNNEKVDVIIKICKLLKRLKIKYSVKVRIKIINKMSRAVRS